MNSAADHGYTVDWSIKVNAGLTCFCLVNAGTVIQKYRVVNTASRGFWNVVMLDGPETGSVFVISEKRILADAYAQ